ncbi:triose-phosphate isomerase [Tetragenococcus solitarius]|uniref:Triose-phosphate isomerase n=1 Tax=Tetragenococcus solitarius TaxID=71453 RepID=A0ABN3Y3G2_9ENTE|nr:triose-phosphate isomerase [Tetragenococcus solitarius]
MEIQAPFFVFNPKSYFYGDQLLKLAQKADFLAEKYPHLTIFITAPYADLANIAKQTRHIIVTAQHMDGIEPGRGMGAVLPESIYQAGVRAVFLNHAEHPLQLAELVQSIKKAKELGIQTIVCADSLEEARAIAVLKPDVLLCEPTELIGSGKTSDESYIQETNKAIKEIDPDIFILQAAGISTPEDVYHTLQLGADGTGCTSGITEADEPAKMLEKMIEAVNRAYEQRKEKHNENRT